jgi:ABC-type Mn2+/Zn2+ transport system ATPase subunit
MDDDLALRTEGLIKRYRSDRSPALDSGRRRDPRELVGPLVGPNAAGKSTLIRTFLGLEVATSRVAALRSIGDVSTRSLIETVALGGLGILGPALAFPVIDRRRPQP